MPLRMHAFLDESRLECGAWTLSYKWNKKSPRGIRTRRCSPSPPGVKNLLRSLKIQVLARVAKDTASICLAEQKPGDWGK